MTSYIEPSANVPASVKVGYNVVILDDVLVDEDATILHGAIIGRRPKVTASIHVAPLATGPTYIGQGAIIGCNVVIYAGTVIGADVLIGDGVTIRENCTIGAGSVIGNNSTLQNDVFIGRNVRVVDLSHITAGVVIEDGAFWSVGVLSMNDNKMGPGGELRPPKVRAGAKVGGGALLLPGVQIGEGAIVGAGSVVTHDVQPGETVMGVPAKRRTSEKDRLFNDFYGETHMMPERPYPVWPPEE